MASWWGLEGTRRRAVRLSACAGPIASLALAVVLLALIAPEVQAQAVGVTAVVAEQVEPSVPVLEWEAGAGLRLMDGEVRNAAAPSRFLVSTRVVRRTRPDPAAGEAAWQEHEVAAEASAAGVLLLRLEAAGEAADGDEVVVIRVVASNS